MIIGIIIAYGNGITQTPIYFLAGVLGSAIGWGLAVFLSPLGAEQEMYFTPVVKSVTAFTTGYLISYMNKFLDMYLFEKEIHLNRFVAAGVFLSFLIVTWITVFLFRYATQRPTWSAATLGKIIEPGLSPTQIASVLVECKQCKQHDIQQPELLPSSAKDVLRPTEGFTFSQWEIKLPDATTNIYVKFKDDKSVATFIESKESKSV